MSEMLAISKTNKPPLKKINFGEAVKYDILYRFTEKCWKNL